MTLDCIDWFCGMGGSSTGLVEAGIEVKLAANHWSRPAASLPTSEPTEGENHE